MGTELEFGGVAIGYKAAGAAKTTKATTTTGENKQQQ
jgi:hypothetical protein